MTTIKLNLNKIFHLLLIGIIISFMMGCSNELTREEAEKQIKIKYQFPIKELKDFNCTTSAGSSEYFENKQTGKRTIDFGSGGDREKPKNEYYATLENEGLINVKRDSKVTSQYQNAFNKNTWNIEVSYFDQASFTDQAKPYIQGDKVITATIEFGEITGIVEQKEMNISKVGYTTMRRDITPFGKVENISEETFHQTATFTKYDDGWRIN